MKERKRAHLSVESKERFIALDVETTGLFPVRGDRVIEIGAVVVELGAATQEFHMLVNAGKRISRRAGKVHGITNELLIAEQGPEGVFPQVHSFIGDGIIVAHNAPFDVGFLRYEFSRLGLRLNNQYLCTLEMSRTRFPRLRNHRLETVYRHLFGEACGATQRHRALDDARMVARVWMEMVRISV